MTFTLISHSLSLKRHRAVLTRSWLVAFESSSGKGLETPKATQLAKMARRIKTKKVNKDEPCENSGIQIASMKLVTEIAFPTYNTIHPSRPIL